LPTPLDFSPLDILNALTDAKAFLTSTASDKLTSEVCASSITIHHCRHRHQCCYDGYHWRAVYASRIINIIITIIITIIIIVIVTIAIVTVIVFTTTIIMLLSSCFFLSGPVCVDGSNLHIVYGQQDLGRRQRRKAEHPPGEVNEWTLVSTVIGTAPPPPPPPVIAAAAAAAAASGAGGGRGGDSGAATTYCNKRNRKKT
jgi:hypothetical protein